jgi:MoxR-like ATPase
MAAQPLEAQGGMSGGQRLQDVAGLQAQLEAAGYVAEPPLAAALLLMLDLQRPLLVEGDAGVGKTEIAHTLAAVRGTRLIRLQCYEGLDVHAAMYEWNYQRQLLAIKLLEHDERPAGAKEQDIFSERYLLRRPLLEAIMCEQPPVLLIDEIDRADEAFEAFLLELLSDFQVSIPELGTVRAVTRPIVVVTSNGTRELSDALRRRCLYQYIDYPSYAKELAILELKRPTRPGSSRGRWWRSCRTRGAWTCARSRASPRRSTGRRRCCAWASRPSTTMPPSASWARWRPW